MSVRTISLNPSNLYKDDSESSDKVKSVSFRELSPNLKIELIKKEFDESFSLCKDDEAFKLPAKEAFTEARELIPQLYLFDEPLFSFIADGSIVFQWTRKPDSILTLSLSGEGTLVFSGIFNRTQTVKKLSGILSFSNFILPNEIKQLLIEYFPDDKFQWIN